MSLKLECNSNQEKYTQPGCGFHFYSNVFFYFYWLSSIFAFAFLLILNLSFYFSLLYFHWLVVVAAMAIHQPSLSPEQSNCIHTEKICNGGQYNAIQCNSIRYYTTCNTMQLHLSPDLSNCIHTEKICNGKKRNPVHFIGNSLFSDRSCCCIPGGCHRITKPGQKKKSRAENLSNSFL